MTIPEIQIFIQTQLYDFNTVRYLLDYGRIKETIPVMNKILNDIDSFNRFSPNAGINLTGVFPEEFWKQNFSKSMTYADLRAALSRHVNNKEIISDKELEETRYIDFVEKIRVWSQINIATLKSRIKSPAQKKTEIILLYSMLILFWAGLMTFLTEGWVTQNFGLKGEFYRGMNFEQMIITGANKTINFGSYVEMNTHIPPEYYSARWTGFLQAPRSGRYTFYLLIDDGARLFIDDKLVINEWSGHNSQEFNNTVFLPQGSHSIRLDYYNACCAAVLKLFWKPGGGEKTIIPAKYLRISKE